jgi:putative restriction endonuclease
VSEADWVRRVTSLNQWKKGGERAPHKPLLLLFALGRLQQIGSARVTFSEAEPALRRLLEEFGPPRVTSPGYPFHHLTNDGVWTVHTPAGGGSQGPNLGALRAGSVGDLDVDFATALECSSHLFAAVVRAILDANFPSSMHNDILAAVDIDIDAAELREARVLDPAKRCRDPSFREKILVAYEYQCAICGYDGQLFREAVGIEAAHIRWWAADGPDVVENGVALCSLHHKLLDRGAIGLTPAHMVAVSSHFIGRSETAAALVLSLVDSPLTAPQSGQPLPHSNNLSWHAAQVFRAPARRGVVA